MKPGKKILVLAAGYYYFRTLKALLDAGFTVLAVDRDPKAYGASVVHHFAPIDITDREGVLAWAREQQIDGILPVNDFGTRTAAYVAQQMDLVGISPEAAHAANDKGAMRNVWQEAGLPQPSYQVVTTLQELKDATAALGFPCVLKPTDCGGSGRGISVLKNEADVIWGYDFAEPYVKNDRFIVESFVDGLELTVESFSQKGEVTILAISDKEKPELRTRVATSLNYPAAIARSVEERVRDIVRQAVLALGITEGMAHTELMVMPDGEVILLETGARGGGGHIFHTIIKAASGFNAPVESARLAVGETVQIENLLQRGAVYRFFNPVAGILKAVQGVEEARQLPGVLDVAVVKKPGEIVGVLQNSLQRAGFVVTTGQNRSEAITRANAAERAVHFEVEPLPQETEQLMFAGGSAC